MRKLLLAAALLGALSLSACSTAEGERPQSGGPSAPDPARSSEVTPEPTEEPAGEPCASYFPDEPLLTPPAGAEEIITAAQNAELPENVTLKIEVQVITSTDDPGTFEVVVRVCSDPLMRDELVAVGNRIAKAIYAVPTHEQVTLLMISPYVPDGDSVKHDDNLRVIQTDYELFLWDTTNRPLDSNWK